MPLTIFTLNFGGPAILSSKFPPADAISAFGQVAPNVDVRVGSTYYVKQSFFSHDKRVRPKFLNGEAHLMACRESYATTCRRYIAAIQKLNRVIA